MRGIDKVTKFLVDNAPAIFTGLAITGSVVTTLLAVKATPKALDELDKAYSKKNTIVDEVLDRDPEPLTKKEVVKATWKCYIPTAISGSATIACIILANRAHIKKETALAAMAGFFEQRYFDYKDKVVEIADADTDKAIETAMAKDRMTQNKPPKTMMAALDKEEMLCYEPITDQYFITTKNELVWATMTTNKILSMEQDVTLNKILKLFPGADCKNPIGDKVGWWLDDSYFEFVGYNWGYYGRPWIEIDPVVENVDGQEVYVVHFSVGPTGEEMWDSSYIEKFPDEDAKKHMEEIAKEGKYIPQK